MASDLALSTKVRWVSRLQIAGLWPFTSHKQECIIAVGREGNHYSRIRDCRTIHSVSRLNIFKGCLLGEKLPPQAAWGGEALHLEGRDTLKYIVFTLNRLKRIKPA